MGFTSTETYLRALVQLLTSLSLRKDILPLRLRSRVTPTHYIAIMRLINSLPRVYIVVQ